LSLLGFLVILFCAASPQNNPPVESTLRREDPTREADITQDSSLPVRLPVQRQTGVRTQTGNLKLSKTTVGNIPQEGYQSSRWYNFPKTVFGSSFNSSPEQRGVNASKIKEFNTEITEFTEGDRRLFGVCSSFSVSSVLNSLIHVSKDINEPSNQVDGLVELWITDSVKFILSSNNITDSIWQKYFYPTTPATSPYTELSWRAQPNGGKVTVRGSGNFSPTVLLNQLYHANAPEPKTPNGQQVGGGWVAFTTSDVVLDSTNISEIRQKDQDYQFKWEATDEAVSNGARILLTYTVIANP